MISQIFVNLPVQDLPRSMAFFRALGFEFNPDYTNEHAACMIVGPNIYSMLITHAYFKTFTPKAIADAKAVSEVLTALVVDTPERLHSLVEKAVAAGGREYKPLKDHGFMLEHGFEDPDGHIWELCYMVPQQA